ncbi:hypothetical protein HKX48_005382 [Thoreauomyces humboldtii]|nr:hypothetical protein HKX48_005382 [Thoreauomyces humboldtii]
MSMHAPTSASLDVPTPIGQSTDPSSSDLPPPAPTKEPQTSIPPPPSVPILLGGLVSSCHILRDEDGEKGLYFVFPDIGVRTSGLYRLKFNLFVVEAAEMGFR